MKKRIGVLVFLHLFLSCLSVQAQEVEIISRSEWGANEEFTYRESTYWTDIVEKRLAAPKSTATPEQQQKYAEIYKQKIDYINKYFAPQNTVTEKIAYEGKEKLAWGIEKSDYVNAIVVHHTETEYADSYTGIKNIFKFHSLSRQWGDIGYNYVIGYDGEIFEGRKGGDYSVAAHSKWNNISTVGIAIMGNYSEKPINTKQYESLEKLIQELVMKYGIDLSKNYYYNTDCTGTACANFPMETYIKKTLSGHRDTGHTNCPGDQLYAQIEEIRLNNLQLTEGFIPVKRGETNKNIPEQTGKSTLPTKENQKIVQTLKKLSPEILEKIVIIIDKRLETEENEKIKKQLQIINIIAKQVLKS